MKSFSPGFSDSIASVIANPRPCPRCDSSSRIAEGLCLGCLLEAGLDPADENQFEPLTDLLAEVKLPDQNWRLGNYEILEEIGRGGMGVIYRARQRHSRRVVAVKRVLSYHSDSRETLGRFLREAQAAASLDHPNILPIYEVSESEDGLPFFSMKFAPGGTLQEVAPALRNDPRRCVSIVARVARAVQYAHSRGILHRDLKPGNILLDARGEPLVADFGLAKWLDATSDLTRTLTIFGTPGYIAPEQVSSPAAELRPTADVYSLGAILFDLLAGRPPFLGSHALSVIHQASESMAPKLRPLSKIADRDLETICARCLEREATSRYRSAHDLAEDLERWLEGRPIIARPVSPPIRIWRWSKRNPGLAGSMTAALILGGIGLVAALSSSRLSSVIQETELKRNSIAVTPFEELDNLSITSSSAQTATNAFYSALIHTNGIRAISPKMEDPDVWSSQEWKKIGQTTGMRFTLAGSVRQRGGRKRITVHLIETTSGSPVGSWLNDVESDSDATTTALAHVANILGISKTLPAVQPDSLITVVGDANEIGGTKNIVARGYYERGRELFLRNNLADLPGAIDSFKTAIENDLNYPQPYAMLAHACLVRSATGPSGNWMEEARRAAATAMRLAPMLPEAQLAQAEILLRKGKVGESVDAYLTAYELDPRSARTAAKIGYVYEKIGRPDLAIGWFEKASRREARPVYADNIGDAWTDLGEYQKAEQAYRKAEIFRPDLPVAALGFARLALFRGDFENARKICQAAQANYKDNSQALMMAAVVEFFSRNFDGADLLYREVASSSRTGGVDFPGSVRFVSALGFIKGISTAHAEEGRALLEEARAIDEKEVALAPENPRCWYSLAASHAALGDEENANIAFDEAIKAGWIDYRSPGLDPRFDSIRGSPSFRENLAHLASKVEGMRRHLPAENWRRP